MSFLKELKRRNVVRMGVLYAVASWVVLQIADVIFEPLGIPGWVFRLMLSLLALGFPFALVFAWIFELTPEGIKREKDIAADDSIVRDTGNRMNIVIVILLVLAIGGLVLTRLVPKSSTGVVEMATPADSVEQSVELEEDTAAKPSSAGEENSIAVLPFVNMSGDPENEYFSDGLTEELLNSLVQLGGLQVTGRTSSFAFKGQNQDLREIGRLLNVANVLEGSVRKAGNRVRITVQLIKASDGYHLWSDTYDRELDDIFAIQAEIADQVSGALHLALMSEGEQDTQTPAPSSVNAQAYEEYLRGMYALQRNPDDQVALEKANSHFNRALEIDPDFVDAYWGLFNVMDRFNRNGFIPYDESLAVMENYRDQLQTLAPGSERALNASARIASRHYDYQASLVFNEETVLRYPGSVIGQISYASTLMLADHLADNPEQSREMAEQAIEAAIKLDPLSVQVFISKAVFLAREGRCDEVEQTLTRTMELDPNVGRLHFFLAACLFTQQADLNRVLAIAEQEPLGYARLTMLAILYDKLGNRERAKQYLDDMQAENADSASYQYGQVYAQWGEPDTAIRWLENAINIHDPGIILAGKDKLLDPLRGDPRFQAILEAAGHR